MKPVNEIEQRGWTRDHVHWLEDIECWIEEHVHVASRLRTILTGLERMNKEYEAHRQAMVAHQQKMAHHDHHGGVAEVLVLSSVDPQTAERGAHAMESLTHERLRARHERCMLLLRDLEEAVSDDY